MPLFLFSNSRSILSRLLISATLSAGRKGVVTAILAVGLLWAQVPSAVESPQQVENLRLWHSPQRTRVVFDVSANVNHRMFSLQNPLRLVVDIENVDFSIKLPRIDPGNKHISAIRSGRPDDKSLRFVFELKQPLKASDFVLSPNELYGHRLVIDLKEQGVAMPAGADSQTASPSLIAGSADNRDRPSSDNAGTVTLTPAAVQSNDRGATETPALLIAIDAGHGGEDPGALGYHGSREKKITLEIAKKLQRIIDQDPRMKSYMVRQGDYYIKLHKRRQMARNANADMFISIHADAFKKRSAQGSSVFALSQSGATSAMAQALATKENASDLIGGVSLADKDDLLAQVLVDLSMTNTISESVNFGGRVLKELDKLGKLHSKRVEQAGFAVLKSADIPSILIETGFITNREEERRLKSSRYQEKLATAIYTAIHEYYQQTPYRSNASYAARSYTPTRAANARPRVAVTPAYHTVVRGDSLSEIALRYGTTVAVIKKLNKLRKNTAILGQRLKLPVSDGSTGSVALQLRPATHIVRSGESLSIISQRYNVTIKSLKAANKLRKDTVYIGQKLKIPGGVAGANAAQIAPAPRIHRVKRGDTLSEIAQQYGSSMGKIMQANSLRSKTVRLGQSLKIPQ